MEKYVGRVKVGRMSPREGAELAIIRLPVKLKNKAGKYAHIFEESENEIRIVFSNSDAIDIVSCQYPPVSSDIEERVRLLEKVVESIRKTLNEKKQGS